jgi:hypothetical protein
MATVMLKGFEAFLTQDPARIENPESILATVSAGDSVQRKKLATRTRGY